MCLQNSLTSKFGKVFFMIRHIIKSIFIMFCWIDKKFWFLPKGHKVIYLSVKLNMLIVLFGSSIFLFFVYSDSEKMF